MPNYCVNSEEQAYSRDHEVHNLDAGCNYMPQSWNQVTLGWFANCKDAVTAAKQHYSDSNGCAYCVPECHTT